MTRGQLVERLAERAGLSARSARAALETLFGTTSDVGLIAAALRDGERVQLAGFGTFEPRLRRPRPGRDPRTRAPILIPGGVAPAFRAGSTLRAAVRGTAKPGGPADSAAPGALGAGLQTPEQPV
jgi:DNA-binding protein HU-beta